jgi:hypothetical protein
VLLKYGVAEVRAGSADRQGGSSLSLNGPLCESRHVLMLWAEIEKAADAGCCPGYAHLLPFQINWRMGHGHPVLGVSGPHVKK